MRVLRPSDGGLGGLWLVVMSDGSCARSAIDPDKWFPVSSTVEAARRESADAIAVCATCPVCAYCLELSLRDRVTGQHGIWGGTLPAERQVLRDRMALRLSRGLPADRAVS